MCQAVFHGTVGHKPSYQVPTHEGLSTEQVDPCCAVPRERVAGLKETERTAYSFLSRSGDCSGKAHPPNNSQVWVRRTHTGSAGPTTSKCRPGRPNSHRGRDTYPCPSPPGPQSRSLEESREVVQRDCMSSHLHTLRIKQIYLMSPGPHVWPTNRNRKSVL